MENNQVVAGNKAKVVTLTSNENETIERSIDIEAIEVNVIKIVDLKIEVKVKRSPIYKTKDLVI